jgi:hypothetical protein
MNSNVVRGRRRVMSGGVVKFRGFCYYHPDLANLVGVRVRVWSDQEGAAYVSAGLGDHVWDTVSLVPED